MKKTICKRMTVALVLTTTVIFTGCSNSNTNSNLSEKQILVSELSSVEGKALEVFNDTPNLTADEKLELLLPNNINEIYSYTSKTSQEYDMESYYNNFVDLFSYVFPNHKMDNKYFLYWGGSSSIEYDDEGNLTKDLNKVQYNYEKLISGEEGRAYFIYDESWYQDLEKCNSPVCLEIGNPMGYGFTTINKGKTVELSNIKKTDPITNQSVYPRLESYNPSEYLEKMGSYSPDSTDSFKLSDKEMKISDAVIFYEDYINSLPYPKEKNCNTVIRSVDVYKVTDDTYGYYFNTNKEYKGVEFDYMPNETMHSKYDEYSTYWGFGFMVESNDIDIIGAAFSLENACDITTYDKVISLTDAAKIVSSNLSSNVTFNVETIELIYTSIPKIDKNGFIDIEDPSTKNSPAWKFTMRNPNDKLTYACYVDAVDGENFRYYKIYE